MAKAYRQDKEGGPEIGKNINEGLYKTQEKNSALCGLDDVIGKKVDSSEKSAAAQSKSNLAFDTQDSAYPDFDSIEGKYDAHSSPDSNFGKYLEKDHIVEKSFPLRAKELTFANDSIWE